MHGSCEQTLSTWKRQALSVLSPASGDTSTRTQATGIGVVNALSPGSDFVLQGYVSNVPAKFLIDTGGCRHGAVVADIYSLMTDVIVGTDFLQTEQCTIEMQKSGNILYFHKQGISIRLGNDRSDPVLDHVSVIISQELHIPPCSEMETMCTVPATLSSGYWILEPDKQCRSAALVARVVVKPECGTVPIRLLNPRNEAVTIAKGNRVVIMPVDSVQEGPQGISEAKQKILCNIVQNIDSLNLQEQEQLYTVLLMFLLKTQMTSGGQEE